PPLGCECQESRYREGALGQAENLLLRGVQRRLVRYRLISLQFSNGATRSQIRLGSHRATTRCHSRWLEKQALGREYSCQPLRLPSRARYVRAHTARSRRWCDHLAESVHTPSHLLVVTMCL